MNLRRLLIFFILIVTTSGHATLLEIDEYHDDCSEIRRLYNTVHHFWLDQKDIIAPIMESIKSEQDALKSIPLQKAFNKIKGNKNSLVREAIQSPREFYSDLQNLIGYIEKNESTIRETGIDFDLFYNEALLMKLTFVSLINSR